MVAIKTKMETMPKNCWHCNHRNLCSYFMVHGCLFNGDRPTNCSLVEIEERKVGKWINAEYETCSVCGYVIEGDHDLDFNYCPHCGAEMRGVENE